MLEASLALELFTGKQVEAAIVALFVATAAFAAAREGRRVREVTPRPAAVNRFPCRRALTRREVTKMMLVNPAVLGALAAVVLAAAMGLPWLHTVSCDSRCPTRG